MPSGVVVPTNLECNVGAEIDPEDELNCGHAVIEKNCKTKRDREFNS
jgi:hypothetical protein